MSRALIVALDGATFRLLDPWLQAGKLPGLAALKARAAHGPLESTLPPITGAAWTSFQTGCEPGRHGLFDWLLREPGGYGLVPINAQLIELPTLWDYLGHHGLRVSVLGVPVTYPPRPVNGFLVSGLLTPEGAGYTHPPELQAELEAAVPGYSTMPEHWPGRYRARAWLRGLETSLARKAAAARFLLQKPWDVFMVHFMETDSAQHQLWHRVDGRPRPRYRDGDLEGDPLLAVFQAADRALGELLEAVPAGTWVWVISDHGFGPLYWNLYLNTWLLRHGYLKLKRSPGTALKRAAFFGLGLTPERLYPWAERLGTLGRGARLRHGQIYERMGRFFLSHRHIDWARTRAYSYGNVGQIYLNLRGREPQGIVAPQEADALLEELRAGLRELKNPLAENEPVLEAVHRKEEVYRGEALERAPELLLVPREGYMALGTSEFISRHVITPTFAGSGWHRPEGILLACGPGIAPGAVRGARLVDLFPTLLYALDLPVPEGLDGRVLEDLFEPRFRGQHPLRHADSLSPAANGHRLSPQDEEEIRRRLQQLGYV